MTLHDEKKTKEFFAALPEGWTFEANPKGKLGELVFTRPDGVELSVWADTDPCSYYEGLRAELTPAPEPEHSALRVGTEPGPTLSMGASVAGFHSAEVANWQEPAPSAQPKLERDVKPANVPSPCPICSRRYCDHTPDERGQTYGQVMGDEPVPRGLTQLQREWLRRAEEGCSELSAREYLGGLSVLRGLELRGLVAWEFMTGNYRITREGQLALLEDGGTA